MINPVLIAAAAYAAVLEKVRGVCGVRLGHDVEVPVEPAATTPAVGAGAVEATPPEPPAPAPTFVDWAAPAICDVLGEHYYRLSAETCDCDEADHMRPLDPYEWRVHVAPIIAERLETALLQKFPQ